ncbi:uncharacterized protein YecT (DUF1311 family) [Sphingomonas trueperi]|uniref:lysozyme inhibitor LprI family protein n=1 Tax=Sphingomonas trueperi TaxID=53317 RepID=UPI0033965401
MIWLALFLAQADGVERTKEDEAFCSSDKSGQPYRFCMADREHARAERQLVVAFARARRAAVEQKRRIDAFRRSTGDVTLLGNPMLVLETSQRVWERSFRADCHLLGLASATGNAGTEGVTASLKCEVDRIQQRVQFLEQAF